MKKNKHLGSDFSESVKQWEKEGRIGPKGNRIKGKEMSITVVSEGVTPRGIKTRQIVEKTEVGQRRGKILYTPEGVENGKTKPIDLYMSQTFHEEFVNNAWKRKK